MTQSQRLSAALFILLTGFLPNSLFAGSMRDRISVASFDTESCKVLGLEEAAAVYFLDMLTKLNRFDIVEREALKEVLKEQALGTAGIVDESMAAEMGKILGLDYIVMGNVIQAYVSRQKAMTKAKEGTVAKPLWKVRGHAQVAYRFIDVKTGRVKATGRKTSRSRLLTISRRVAEPEKAKKEESDAVKIVRLMAKTQKMVKNEAPKEEDPNITHRDLVETALQAGIWSMRDDVFNAFPLKAYVLEVTNPKKRLVLVDIGSSMGVRKGDKFNIIVQHPPRIHPVTKKKMRGKREVIGDIKLQTIYESTSVGRYSKGANTRMDPGREIEAKPRKRGLFGSR